ncbi:MULTISPECIES: hypothetical protein [unclassified Tenacibaculum]|uniref:hypothetical protein n=1 Tax=unclassified Tenacibaculum TaxID=2635139 RepID=UPI001F31BE9F|nr:MULTISPECIES: hypothetical protein [unclassified Tenacibaculum]MCF2874674.1 hypothetical protein [Tenacibaculum sp. Cn5-1]MCF2934260.1 hypothetical protein [Tenacibaculum sp. Cn5-34]MCG7510470.1 hypothetical protein [Tenacibaculum sp. Cn5-46]
MKNNKLLLSIATTLLMCFSMFSQEDEKLKSLFKTDFNLSGLGISYEVPLAEKWTVDLSTGIGASYNVSNGLEARWIINKSPSAYFKSEFKYIYNREKRFKAGKNNSNNSGNYWAFQTKYITKRFSEAIGEKPGNNVLMNEVHWGIQRSLGGNWLFNAHVGLGFAKDFDTPKWIDSSTIYPAVGVKFSYVIF